MDRSLVEQAQRGDRDAYDALVRAVAPRLYRTAHRIVRDFDAAQDATQLGLVAIWRELPRLRDPDRFEAWAYRLVVRYCLMELRSSGKHEFVQIEENFMEKDAFVHLDIEDTREGKLTVMEKCIEKLPQEQRETISLFYLEQKCYKDVADITGYDLNKVKSYIQNGKRNLKICIEKNGEE